jgi:uncharacterized protein YfdQ (DUF2303 family)
MPNTSFADFVTDWEHLLKAVDSNAADLPQLEANRAELLATVESAKAIDVRQSSLRSELSQATRDLEAAMARGRDLASRLRAGIRAQYGLKGEKLREFGLKPFRRRSRTLSRPDATPPPASPGPPAPPAEPRAA